MANMAVVQMFNSQSADGQSSTTIWLGGEGQFIASGTFGSGTAKLQCRVPSANGGDGTWVDVGTNTEFTADGVGLFKLGTGMELRVDLAGSTSPDLDAFIVPVSG